MSAFKCVIFNIGRSSFAMDIQYINNISDYKEITKVPDVPPEVVGVIDIRGEVIPIINLAERLGTHSTLAKEDAKIMIVHFEGLNAGFLVDEASRVLEVHTEDIQAAPSMIHAHDLELIRGILNINNHIVVLLELNKIFEALKGGLKENA